MEAELAALASSGATSLVGLMVSDAWAQARGRFARLFARGGADGRTDEQLQEAREELLTARESGDTEAAGDVEAEWRTRLRRLLRSDPAAAGELRALLAELAPQATGGTVVVVNNSINGVANGTVVQGQNVTSGLFIHHTSTRPARGELDG